MTTKEQLYDHSLKIKEYVKEQTGKLDQMKSQHEELVKKAQDDVLENKEKLEELKGELYKLYEKHVSVKKLLESIERGDLTNGIKFHYIPKKDKPHEIG